MGMGDPVKQPDLPHPIQEILAHNERRRREIASDFYSLLRLPNLFIYTQRMRSLIAVLRREGAIPLADRRILEVGCGAADWLLYLVICGASPHLLSGIDLDEVEISRASRRLPAADIREGNAAKLPWQDGSFDIVLQMTAFSTMLKRELRQAVAREMLRVLKPGGLILWYDLRMDNPRNPGIRPVKTKEVKQLFPGCSVRLRPVTLIPPLARQIVPLSWVFGLFLEKIPFLRSHLLGSIRPARSSGLLPENKSS